MASRKTLNAKNLEALGAVRLSELLIEITRGNGEAKRRLRLELAGAQGPGDIAIEIRKRLVTIARSRSFIEWDKIKPLVRDLESHRCAIVDHVAKADPSEALDLLWRFMALANSIFERSDDSNGVIIEIFHECCCDLGEIAAASKSEPTGLADRIFQALEENDYGQYDGLIETLAPALGKIGLKHLKQRFVTLSKEPLPKVKPEDRKVIGWGSGGALYADEIAERRRESMISLALKSIADVSGDVDGYIAQQSDKARTVPAVAAGIARRLLEANRAEEAWSAINRVKEDRRAWIPYEWENVKIEVLVALGRDKEAQEFRWACFEKSLNKDHLRSYLRHLPDFDDMEAEARAMVFALRYSSVLMALDFLISWPALEEATELVLTRAGELDGNRYEILTLAAAALEHIHPLATTVLLRALIDFALEKGRSTRYRHAARHLQSCGNLAKLIEDFGSFETHAAYESRLRAAHGKKASFWNFI